MPIIPGIKPLYKKSQLSVLPKTFRVDMPPALVAEIEKCKNEADVALVGQEWCTAQCKELIANGVPSIHFYTVNAVEQVYEVAKSIY